MIRSNDKPDRWIADRALAEPPKRKEKKSA
jgi:hypothetical protein